MNELGALQELGGDRDTLCANPLVRQRSALTTGGRGRTITHLLLGVAMDDFPHLSLRRRSNSTNTSCRPARKV